MILAAAGALLRNQYSLERIALCRIVMAVMESTSVGILLLILETRIFHGA